MAQSTRSAGSSEIKFVLDAAHGEQVRAWARRHLEPDPHGSGPWSDDYLTTTLYLDTPDYDVFFRRGSNGRAKYRIRRYGSSDTVFLERKLRTAKALIKRRTLVPMADIARLAHGHAPEWEGSWLQRRMAARQLRPMCQISYHRMARGLGTATGPIRLTVDESLLVGPIETLRFGEPPATPFFGGRVIVEMKYRAALPHLFKSLIEELKIAPARVSKYRLGMVASGRVTDADLTVPVGELRSSGQP